jgi:hypothetical protein
MGQEPIIKARLSKFITKEFNCEQKARFTRGRISDSHIEAE